MKYRVLTACRSDKTGASFEPGDTVTEKDFPKAVISNWLEIGVLELEPVVVGERGPELFAPQGSGKVVKSGSGQE